MKKLIAMVLVFVFCLSFTACEDKEKNISPPTTPTTTHTFTTTSANINVSRHSNINSSASDNSVKTKIHKPTNTKSESTLEKPEIRYDVMTSDKFTSIDQMIAKAKTYQTLDDVYKSAGYDPKGNYYLGFREEKLTAIFNERKIIVPEFSCDFHFQEGSLTSTGYYTFTYLNSKGTLELLIGTCKDSSMLEKGQKPISNVNGFDIYTYEKDRYFWFYDGYCIVVVPQYKMSKDEMKELIDNLNLTVVAI